MSYEPIADDRLATVVTYLEMHAPTGSPVPPSPLSLRRMQPCAPDAYRTLFRLVGARWLWFSRLAMDDAELTAVIDDADVEIYAVVDESGRDCGLLELDFREPRQCQLAFLGLVPQLSGKGHGRWLLSEALRLAWREGIVRVQVHTCSLDHPAALPAYRRAGFIARKRGIEIFPDPRLLGLLPRDCAPQVPLLGTETSALSRAACE